MCLTEASMGHFLRRSAGKSRRSVSRNSTEGVIDSQQELEEWECFQSKQQQTEKVLLPMDFSDFSSTKEATIEECVKRRLLSGGIRAEMETNNVIRALKYPLGLIFLIQFEANVG